MGHVLLPSPTHPLQPGLRSDRAPGGLAALPLQTLTEPTLIVPGAKLGAVSQDRRLMAGVNAIGGPRFREEWGIKLR